MPEERKPLMRPWPDVVLPVPPVWVGRGTWCVEDDSLVYEGGGHGLHRVALPEDFWMRELLELDLEDAGAIAAFSSAYGMLDPQQGPIHAPRTLDAYRMGAVVMRNVARVVLAIVGDSPRSFLAEIEEGDRPIALPNEDAELVAADWAACRLDAGLQTMHPRVVFGRDDALYSGAPELSVATLYDVLCVQVFNYIATRDHLSRCEWEPCHREFIFQRGRTVHGGHRRSAKYCSAECATAAAKKAYRDRKARDRQREEVNDHDQTK